MIVCAVRDRAIDAFGTPFFVPALGAAMRGFGDECRNPESVLNKHPEDYDLYRLGEFDSGTGLFTCGTPLQIAIGKDQINSKE